MLETLRSRGHIYKGTYSGWYCVPEESFLTEDQLKEARGDDGKPRKVSAETGHPVEWMEETNYMFRLSALQGELLSWLKTEPVRPARFQQQLLAWVGGPSALRDVSVSRPSSRVHWGVPVPGDHGQTVYVWLDALVNYLTAAGYPGEPLPGHWPPSLHVIGKDILKFHGIYWPAFLISAGLEPPQAILCHSHWTVDGEKMSKSRGNVINPLGCAEVFTASGLRYFLLREGTPHSDANYSETKVMRVLNSELADTLGNLLSRSCARAVNPAQVFPGYDTSLLPSLCGSEGQQLLESLAHLPDAVAKHYEECAFYRGVDVIMGTLRLANRLFEVQRPWELAKCGGDNERLRCTLHLAMEALRVCGIALQPVAPSLAGRVLDKLGVPAERRCWADMQTCADQDAAIGKQQVILYQRVLSGR
ncbi:methionine--tRNA ligase, mitochondrial isoform X2 [Bacillus rossius redtenbacheri]|uniref:methionine--tRNA ligase, mitochondrial isoform X2 n=1 Tax=Bacillus rossius redtenbacheri TaxID=93214 RepID=UPI002FDDC7FE